MIQRSGEKMGRREKGDRRSKKKNQWSKEKERKVIARRFSLLSDLAEE